MNRTKEIKKLLEEYPQYQEKLFTRGYLITSKEIKEGPGLFPFYNNWRLIKHYCDSGELILNIYVHTLQKYHICEVDGITALMIGHCYNPFTQETKEVEILRDCISSYKNSRALFFEKVSELTGIHLILLSSKDDLIIVQDCCGLMPVYYGNIAGEVFLSSHGQLVADLCGLEMSDKVRRYIGAPFYKIGISQLCGLDSPFKELSMLSPNTYLEIPNFKINRFYPSRSIESPGSDISSIQDILKQSIKLCTEKWDCNISLTGGVDSKLTLAAANGYYDKLKYFSFISSEAERKDAWAARNICSSLGLKHTIYEIPEDISEIKDFEIVASIMDHNQSYIRKKYGRDTRKRAYLANHASIGVEIKSHVSEVGRAFYYKKLGKEKFSLPLTPRNMSNLAKRNFFNRSILKNMDESYQKFIDTTHFGNFPRGFDETDMFYWENRMAAWGALVKQSFDVSHETTIIYNNRRLLEAFLAFPLEDRIIDRVHHKLTKALNPNVSRLNISNNNAMKGKQRILLEKLFFEVNSRLP